MKPILEVALYEASEAAEMVEPLPQPVNLTRWKNVTIAALVAEQLQIQRQARGNYSHEQEERWYALDWQLYLRGF